MQSLSMVLLPSGEEEFTTTKAQSHCTDLSTLNFLTANMDSPSTEIQGVITCSMVLNLADHGLVLIFGFFTPLPPLLPSPADLLIAP